jgi:tripeptide aminopeptidase
MKIKTLKINKKRLVKRFLDYVKINSISKNEANFIKRLIKDLKALKIKCRQDKIGNIIGKIRGKVRKGPR